MYTDAPEAVAIVQAAFPDYRHSAGKLQVEAFKGPITPTSYWAGGTRDYWSFVRLSDLKASPSLPENGSGFTPDSKDVTYLPEGFALVCCTVGNYRAARIYLPEANMTKLLPAPIDLTADERLVLTCTARFKSSHRREAAARKWSGYIVDATVIKRWDAAVESLKAKGLLAKNGSATTDGRNQAGDYYSLPSEMPGIPLIG